MGSASPRDGQVNEAFVVNVVGVLVSLVTIVLISKFTNTYA